MSEFGERLLKSVREAAAIVRNMRDPITTRHIGTIAFQGTEAEIDAVIRRSFGVDAKGKV